MTESAELAVYGDPLRDAWSGATDAMESLMRGVGSAASTARDKAAALAANDLVALLHMAENAAVAAGLTPEQARDGLGHLMQTALDAVRRLPNGAPLRLRGAKPRPRHAAGRRLGSSRGRQ